MLIIQAIIKTSFPRASFPRAGAKIASAAFLAAALSFPASALDVTDNLSIGATVTGVLQHGEFSRDDMDDQSRGTVVTDIGISFRPTDRDAFDLVVSFASGNSLNNLSPYSAHPLYADDLEDNLENINGRGRNYLLGASYKHTFTLSETTSLGLTGGIISATSYIDDNEYANNEVGQFMNEAFVNNTLMVPPDFDVGIAAELEGGIWSARGVWMSSKNVEDFDEDGNNEIKESYNYFAGQLGYHTDTGNYRLWAQGTGKDFSSPDATAANIRKGKLSSAGLSLDHQIFDTVGAFARFAWQDDDAAVTHDTLYSGGLNIKGMLWGRADDELGIGYTYLDGGNGDIEETDVVEGYVKFQLSGYADLSLDVQYLDERNTADGDSNGFVYGARFNVYF